MSNVFSGIVHNYKNDIMVSLMVSIYPSIASIAQSYEFLGSLTYLIPDMRNRLYQMLVTDSLH